VAAALSFLIALLRMPWGILFAGSRQSAAAQNLAAQDSSMEVKV